MECILKIGGSPEMGISYSILLKGLSEDEARMFEDLRKISATRIAVFYEHGAWYAQIHLCGGDDLLRCEACSVRTPALHRLQVRGTTMHVCGMCIELLQEGE